MRLSSLTAAEASALSVRALGLDSGLIELTSQEGLAASLRRAASFMCPTGSSQLVNAVLTAVQPLAGHIAVSKEQTADLLDLLISGGDLLELSQEQEDQSLRLLYLGPPSYIERAPGIYLLLGIRPFGNSLLDPELGVSIEHEEQTRTITLDPATADERLTSAGLQRIEREHWIARPRPESAASLIDRVSKRLNAAGSCGGIEGLQVLDPARPLRYYRGRWRLSQPGDTGDFVARRPQAYGADLWCVVRLVEGSPTKMIEFPVDDPLVPGRDEAWRTQMAIDSRQGHPQRYRTEPFTSGEATIVKFFSPIPGFAERYLRLVGRALAKPPGALFAFRVPNGAMPSLTQLLADMLWMEPDATEEAL